jgi:hypothetical protein
MKDKHYEKHWNAICNSEVISGAYIGLKWDELPEPMALCASNLLDLLVPYQYPTVFVGLFTSLEDIAREFDIDIEVLNEFDVCIAFFERDSYDGYGYVVLKKEELFYEVFGAWNRTTGLYREWRPEQTTLEELQARFFDDRFDDYPDSFKVLIEPVRNLGLEIVPCQGLTETVKIKWKYVYYPFGGWFFEDGKTQPKIKGNFRAFYEGREILVMMSKIKSYEGDERNVPNLVDAQTFENIEVDVESVFIEVSINV